MSRWMSYAVSRDKHIFPNEVFIRDHSTVFVYIVHGPPNLCLQVGTIDWLNSLHPGVYATLFHFYPARKGEDRNEWRERMLRQAYDPIPWDELKPWLEDAKVEPSLRDHTPFILLDTNWHPLFTEPMEIVPDESEIYRREGALRVIEERNSADLLRLNSEFQKWEEEYQWIQREKTEIAKLL